MRYQTCSFLVLSSLVGACKPATQATDAAQPTASIVESAIPVKMQPTKINGVPGKTAGAQTLVRTESFPRPPYSGATYFIYERNGQVICTKLKVCNKYDECRVSYNRGRHKDREDIETGAPYDTTAPVVIQGDKLKKHVCLVKFKLIAD